MNKENKKEYKYRIREVRYKFTNTRFYPQINYIDDNDESWKSLSMKAAGLNRNGFDWCESYDDAMEIINIVKHKDSDEIVEEKIHDIK